METKSRIRNLTTRYFFVYKYGVVVLCFLAIGFSLFLATNGFSQYPNILGTPSLWYSVIFLLSWIKIHKRVHRVEFDNDFLYVIRGEQDTVIPLENIKDVEIKTMVGFYQIDLYNPEDFGSQLYFKPSLLYPLNFKKKDALVDVLRNNIELAKRKHQPVQKNALHS